MNDLDQSGNTTKFTFTSIYIDHGLQDKCVMSICDEFNLNCTMLKHFHTSLTVILHNLYAKTFAAPLKQHILQISSLKTFNYANGAIFKLYQNTPLPDNYKFSNTR